MNPTAKFDPEYDAPLEEVPEARAPTLPEVVAKIEFAIDLLDALPVKSREIAITRTKLQEGIMWAREAHRLGIGGEPK